MKGAILERGIEQYTNLSLFLPIIKEDILFYNWLLTDIDSNYQSDSIIKNDYEFLSGREFVQLIDKNEFRFAWGVFSAFPKERKVEEIVLNGLPFADGNTEFWENPISMQNPLAVTEMVLWDGILALIISRNDKTINQFLNFYEFSESLEDYNNRKCGKINGPKYLTT
ncbi:MAG: hypothetical protein RR588_09600 [Solibacillus sp.]